MPLILSGTNGVSGVDGSAGTPSYQGTDTNTGIFYPAADTIAFAEGGAEIARFDSSGNLGIGTNSPGASLHVAGAIAGSPTGSGVLAGIQSNFAIIHMNGSASTGGIIDFSESGTDYKGRIQYDNANNFMGFSTNNTERMRIDSSGNVGIGISAPGTKLQVVNTGSTDTRISVGNANAGFQMGVEAAGPCLLANFVAQPIYFATNGAERVRISANGSRQFTTQNANTIYAGDATFTLSNSTVTFDLATVFPDLVGNGAGMGIMLLINQWSGAPNTGITQLTIGQKSSGWTFSTIATTGSGTGSSVSGSGTVITVTSGSGFGQIRVWVTSRN